MPRSYGITNVAPYPSAPAVGSAGDEYYNTTNKTMYISDGVNWNPSGGAPYAPVSATPPNASAPTVAPPMGLLFVDTSITSASFQGPPGQPDLGVNSATPDINTFQTSGNSVITGTPSANAPPIPAGPFILEVLSLGNGSYIQQRATLISQNQYIATRVYTGGAWGAWHSPAAGLVSWLLGPSTALTIPVGAFTVMSLTANLLVGRNYKVTTSGFFSNTSTASNSVRTALQISPQGSGVTNQYIFASSNLVASDGVSTCSTCVFVPTATGAYTCALASPQWNGAGGTVSANQCTILVEDMGV